MESIKEMKPRIILVPICIAILSLVALAQINSGANAFMNWSRKNIMRINTLDPGAGFSDLRALKPVIGQARVVALGETHGTHELLRLRNRLFQYLVYESEFTAIAAESGVTESMLAEDFAIERDSFAATLARIETPSFALNLRAI